MVCMALITATVLCDGCRNSFISVSMRSVHVLFSTTRFKGRMKAVTKDTWNCHASETRPTSLEHLASFQLISTTRPAYLVLRYAWIRTCSSRQDATYHVLMPIRITKSLFYYWRLTLESFIARLHDCSLRNSYCKELRDEVPIQCTVYGSKLRTLTSAIIICTKY